MQLWLDISEAEMDEVTAAVAADLLWTGPFVGCKEVTIDSGDDQFAAREQIGMVDWLVISCSDWTMIPLENLVAAAAGSGTKIVAAISHEEDIRGAAFALELGVDALLLPPPTSKNDSLWRIAEVIAEERRVIGSADTESGYAGVAESDGLTTDDEKRVNYSPLMVKAEITAIEDGGIGERVCIDLTSTLEDGEGLLIGSSSLALCLVHGETIANEHVPTRPFRVNAGAVHAYVLMADGSTKYLSELAAADEVVICDRSGVRRTAFVGRLKIERRPFLLIKFKLNLTSSDADSKIENDDMAENTVPSDSLMLGQIFTQQAETVRLISPEGIAISVTRLKAGDAIIVRSERSARHMGGTVSATIEER
jgi:3-dehydroquinate synthase II